MLQAEKAKHFLYQAKYGRFGLSDPLHALQRDSDMQRDASFGETAVKAMYDDQLAQLDNLIATQHRAQQQMKEQLVVIDKRYLKVNNAETASNLETTISQTINVTNLGYAKFLLIQNFTDSSFVSNRY